MHLIPLIKLIAFGIILASSFIVFYWFIYSIIDSIKRKRENKNKIIAKNIVTYIEYFRDIPLELQQELIESELNNPFLN